MSLPTGLELGGRKAVWVWSASAHPASALPAAVLIDHGDHTLLVPWVPTPQSESPFTLDSLLPLTVVEEVVCGVCGLAGRIVDSTWRPRAEVAS